MRTIRQSTRFGKNLKRESAGRYRQTVLNELPVIISSLANDAPLASSLRDHALTGEWLGFRDCHVKPDLVLVYRKTES